MIKKSIALFTIVSLMFFSLSCYMTKTQEVKTVSEWEGRDIEVLKLEKKSGETVEFSEEQPGKIPKNSILIVSPNKVTVELDIADIKYIKSEEKEHEIKEITTNDGKYYYVISAEEHADKMIITAYEAVPLTDIKMIVFKEAEDTRPFTSVLLLFGAAAGVLALLVLIWACSYHN